jgi:hypothetical protein
MYYAVIFLEGLRRTTKNLSQDNRFLGRALNPGPTARKISWSVNLSIMMFGSIYNMKYNLKRYLFIISCVYKYGCWRKCGVQNTGANEVYLARELEKLHSKKEQCSTIIRAIKQKSMK